MKGKTIANYLVFWVEKGLFIIKKSFYYFIGNRHIERHDGDAAAAGSISDNIYTAEHLQNYILRASAKLGQ